MVATEGCRNVLIFASMKFFTNKVWHQKVCTSSKLALHSTGNQAGVSAD